MRGPGFFGDSFDADGNGRLDTFEQAAERMAYDAMHNSDAMTNGDADYGMMRAGISPARDWDHDSNDFDED